MSEGKANAQSGHAYLDALLHSLGHSDHSVRQAAQDYAQLKPGTKICLDGGPAGGFDRLVCGLVQAGIPFVTITDRDHVELPHFDGNPIVTAIGIGPLSKSEIPPCLKRLKLWKGGARSHLGLSQGGKPAVSDPGQAEVIQAIPSR